MDKLRLFLFNFIAGWYWIWGMCLDIIDIYVFSHVAIKWHWIYRHSDRYVPTANQWQGESWV